MDESFLHIDHHDFSATILMQGAQLIHFQPTGGKPLLWSAKPSTFESGKAFRGGVPICWPWFGKASVPSHGFARISQWTLLQRVDELDIISLQFGLHDSQQTRQMWPHEFTLTMSMILCKSGVTLTLSIDTSQQTTGALHTYFWTDDIVDVHIKGLGENYLDALDGHTKSGNSEIQIEHETDRVYTQPATIVHLYESNSHTTIHHLNASDVVVWNPWVETSAALSDMVEDDYRHMVCIETARIHSPLDPKDSFGCELVIQPQGQAQL